MIEISINYDGLIPLSNGKIIQQYDENFILINEFSSYCDAVSKTGITQTRISRGCRTNCKIENFYWKAINFIVDKNWWFEKLPDRYRSSYCTHCGKKIDSTFILNVDRKNRIIRVRSSFGKIVCSNSCSKSITNLECHKNDPERGKRFNSLMIEQLNEKGFDNFYHEPEKIRLCRSIQNSKDNPKWHSSHTEEDRKRIKDKAGEDIRNRMEGKSFDEIYGKEKSKKIRQKISENNSGEKNPMFGKPSPQYSGGGFIGRYKNLRFRSLIELSYIKSILDSNIKIESAENQKFKVEYIDKTGQTRNYFPDFYLPESNTVIEIKHYKSLKDMNVKLKCIAAKKNFDNFILLTNKEIDMIHYTTLYEMIKENNVELCKRSLNKLEKLINYVA